MEEHGVVVACNGTDCGTHELMTDMAEATGSIILSVLASGEVDGWGIHLQAHGLTPAGT